MDYLWTFIAFGVYLLVMLLIGFLILEKSFSKTLAFSKKVRIFAPVKTKEQ